MKTWILILGLAFSGSIFAGEGEMKDGEVHEECKRVFASNSVKPIVAGKTCAEAYGEGAVEDGSGNCVIPATQDSADR